MYAYIAPEARQQAHAIFGRDELCGRSKIDIWEAIAAVKVEIASWLGPHAQEVKPRWVPGTKDVTPGYGASLFDYMQVVNEARERFAEHIESLGHYIATLENEDGKGWQENEHRVQLNQELVHTIQELRHDPAKGPGLAFFDVNGQLSAYAAGSLWRPEVPFSSAMQTELLEAHSRRRLAICGERTVMAQKLGVEYPDLDLFRSVVHDKTHKPLTELELVETYMTFHSFDIARAARKTPPFPDSTLQITIKVCSTCLPSVIHGGVKHIITDDNDKDNGIREIRQASMDQMDANLPPDVTHTRISRLAPIKLVRQPLQESTRRAAGARGSRCIL